MRGIDLFLEAPVTRTHYLGLITLGSYSTTKISFKTFAWLQNVLLFRRRRDKMQHYYYSKTSVSVLVNIRMCIRSWRHCVIPTVQGNVMIANLAVASLFMAVSSVLEDFIKSSSTLCKIQGALLTFSILECILWDLGIMFNLYFRVVCNVDIVRLEMILTSVFWLVPALPMALGFIYDLYAPAGSWCWIKNNWKWRLATVYIWQLLSVAVYIFIMVHLLIIMHKRAKERHNDSVFIAVIRADIRTLRAFPVIYFLVNIGPVVVWLQNPVGADQDQTVHTFGLLLLQSVAVPFYGATLAVVYILNRDTRKKMNWTDVHVAFQRWCRKNEKINEFQING